VFDESALERWRHALAAAELVCFDTETTSLEPLAPWFADPARAKVGQNVKYDQHVLANHGIALAGVAHDTLLESYVLESHRPHDMDNLAWRHLDVKTISYADVAGKGASQIGFDQVPVDAAAEYSAEDADITLQLHRALHPRLAQDPRLLHVYAGIEMPVREVLFRMERTGVLIDSALLARQSRELGERVVALEQQAFQLAGQPFNLASPKQLGEILFTRMGLPTVKKTATGQPSTDEEVLQELAADYPLPKLLLEHRALSKLKSTYTDKLPQMVNPRTGRVHTTFAQATAVTGRLASSDPNLQNIPVRTEEGRGIRRAFVPEKGWRLLSADYSQIELRLLAHFSRDVGLMEAFHEGQDVHRATAARVFKVAPAAVTPDLRSRAKAVNFGVIYGMGPQRLARETKVSMDEAKRFIDSYFETYPGVRAWLDGTIEAARTLGYVSTLLGRRRYLPEIHDADPRVKAQAENVAMNTPLQGTAADVIKLAMIHIDRRLTEERWQARMLLQVHDELVFEAPPDEVERLTTMVKKEMSGAAKLAVPLVVDVGVGDSWADAH
jgi:DNA polymerase I